MTPRSATPEQEDKLDVPETPGPAQPAANYVGGLDPPEDLEAAAAGLASAAIVQGKYRRKVSDPCTKRAHLVDWVSTGKMQALFRSVYSGPNKVSTPPEEVDGESMANWLEVSCGAFDYCEVKLNPIGGGMHGKDHEPLFCVKVHMTAKSWRHAQKMLKALQKVLDNLPPTPQGEKSRRNSLTPDGKITFGLMELNRHFAEEREFCTSGTQLLTMEEIKEADDELEEDKADFDKLMAVSA